MTATKIHAAVCRKFGAPLTVEQLSLAAPGDGELQVRVAFCAICHSDIHYAAGAWGGRLPAVYGHEAAGVVEAVGAGVDGATVGDQVVVTLLRACGRCHHCARGESQVCGVKLALDRNSPLSDSDGNPVAQGLRTAAFAERTVVHHSQVVVIDKEMPLAAASLLACGVITGHGAVTNTAGVRPGSSTVTIGAGGVGLNCIQGAKACGAHANIAVDVSDAKLKAATAFGATHVVNPGMCDAKSEVRAITKGGADYVFVAVGSTEAVEQGLTLLRRGGALVLSTTAERMANGFLADLDKLLSRRSPGECDVYIRYRNPAGTRVLLQLGEDYKLRLEPAFVDNIRGLAGEGNMQIRYDMRKFAPA